MELRVKAFVIFVNGERICSMGLTPNNTRSVQFAWIGGPEGQVFLHAGGMDDRDHVDWEMPELEVGDEVTVKVMDCDETDPPTRRRTVEQVDAWARSLKPKTDERSRSTKKCRRFPRHGNRDRTNNAPANRSLHPTAAAFRPFGVHCLTSGRRG